MTVPKVNNSTSDSEADETPDKEFKIMIIRMINKINRIQIDT
jgi:hypothetical protein